jgi:renalase
VKVGIIGAGLSGLAAARELGAAGHRVVVIEKSRGVGGRLASRRIEGTVVDHGAPTVEVPEGSAFGALVASLPPDDLIRLGPSTIAYRSGATRLAKLMADGLEIVLGVRIGALRRSGSRYELAGEQGNAHGEVDAVIVSAPAPQAAELLQASPEGAGRAEALRAVTYDPAVMILAGLRIGETAQLEPFATGDAWSRITVESAKGRPVVDGAVPIVARLSAAASRRMMDVSDADVLGDILPQLAAVCGEAGPPAWVQVKRWRYATVATPADAASVNPAGARILVCGDSIAGGGLASVFSSGVDAARTLMATMADEGSRNQSVRAF